MANVMSETVAFDRTPEGQLLYDLAFVDRTDKWLARKHGLSAEDIRRLRDLPAIAKLVTQRRRLAKL